MKVTTLHKNEHYKIYGKIEFFLFFGFVKQATNKVYPQLSLQAISREVPQTR